MHRFPSRPHPPPPAIYPNITSFIQQTGYNRGSINAVRQALEFTVINKQKMGAAFSSFIIPVNLLLSTTNNTLIWQMLLFKVTHRKCIQTRKEQKMQPSNRNLKSSTGFPATWLAIKHISSAWLNVSQTTSHVETLKAYLQLV